MDPFDVVPILSFPWSYCQIRLLFWNGTRGFWVLSHPDFEAACVMESERCFCRGETGYGEAVFEPITVLYKTIKVAAMVWKYLREVLGAGGISQPLLLAWCITPN